MKNLQEILKAAETDLQHIVKTTIFLQDIKDFGKINEAYGNYFKDHKPPREKFPNCRREI